MVDETNYDKVKRFFKMKLSNKQISEKLNISEKTIRNYVGIIKRYEDNPEPTKVDANVNINTDEDLNIETLSEKLGIDLNFWEPSQIIGNQWGENKQLKIRYNKIIENDALHKAIENVISKINSNDIELPKYKYDGEGDVLLEISIYDHHFGKLAHKDETGNNYDLKIAKKLYYEAFDNILTRAKNSNKIDRILFPVGQDLFHVNNEINTTVGGTFQDTDSRLTKIFETVQETLINCIDKMLKVAPVDIVYVSDNHGPINSYFMCKVIEAYYKNNPNVTVDTSNLSRKYYQYGNTLIGMCHGHSEKADTLALTMACEAKQLWANTMFHEFHLGHYHKRAEKKYNTVDSLGDVIVRYLPSLCGTDKWHETKGYNTTRKFCECYLYDKTNGPIGSLIYNKVKEE